MHTAAPVLCCPLLSVQVTKYVEREILNHRCLVHPHIVQFKEVRCKQQARAEASALLHMPAARASCAAVPVHLSQ
jgi:hypothetical protein